MRLKKEHIDRISTMILNGLKNKKLIKPRVPDEKIRLKIIETITADLHAEDQVDAEARKLMEGYRKQIESGQIDERKMFQMIKKQLVKDKKMVL
ncbi:MAG: DUF507 family protein [Deltaproteobacteria bacterium]|nr:DUF507 family protein [Deltaproteobacteria bacterium]